jgi:CRISPR-associated exonuclease Cas4
MEVDTYVAISALQHLIYCERQAALIHVERIWSDDVATTLGNLMHERADLPGSDHRRGVKVQRAVMLRSLRLQLYGVADVVEYHSDPGNPTKPRPMPVEYKVGKTKDQLADQVQLCAQAICLEEMHATSIAKGVLFYGASHKRLDVIFDAALRQRTEDAARRLHQMIEQREVPRPIYGAKCRKCSLIEKCLPEVLSESGRATAYLARLTKE